SRRQLTLLGLDRPALVPSAVDAAEMMDEAKLPAAVRRIRSESRALLRPLLPEISDADFLTMLDNITRTMLKEHRSARIRDARAPRPRAPQTVSASLARWSTSCSSFAAMAPTTHELPNAIAQRRAELAVLLRPLLPEMSDA